jgi:hypothetical protein
VPAGAHGRLTLIYRPAWLIWGSVAAAGCVFVVLLAFIFWRREQLTSCPRCVGRCDAA